MIGLRGARSVWTAGRDSPHAFDIRAQAVRGARARRARPASSAGRIARRQARGARRHAAPLNARLATVAKPASSSRSASSRCAVRSAEGSSPSTFTHQQSTRRPPGRTSSAPASPTSQTPSAPRSSDEPGAGVQLARLVAEQVAEQPERRPLRRRRPRAARGRTTARRGWRTAPGSPTRARRAIAATGNESGSSASSSDRRAEERHGVGERAQRPAAPAPAQPRGVEPRPPVDGRGLGEAGATLTRRRSAGAGSRARRRAGSSRTCSACPSPVLTTA